MWKYNAEKKIWGRSGYLANGRLKHIMANYYGTMIVLGGVSKISYKYSTGCAKKFRGVHFETDLQKLEEYKFTRKWEEVKNVDECIPAQAYKPELHKFHIMSR